MKKEIINFFVTNIMIRGARERLFCNMLLGYKQDVKIKKSKAA